MNIDDLLSSTKPILYETGDDAYPYAFSGTCYPIKYRGALFIVSAFHCFENFKIRPEQTLYPRPEYPTEFFAFDTTVRVKAPQANDDEHYDHVLLRVARSHHTQGEMDKIVALDLGIPSNVRKPTDSGISDFRIRGYPHDAPLHKINYDPKQISEQAYSTNGYVGVRKASYDLCYLIRMVTPIPQGMHPNGMSGTPLYGITYDQKPVFWAQSFNMTVSQANILP